jgi:hypothetical protein
MLLTRKLLLGLSLLLSCLQAAGCGPAKVPPSDSQQALVLVEKLLGQWKSGATIEELAKMTPPTYVSEDLWKKGVKLTEYKIVGEGEMLGPNVRFKVALKYAGKNGAVAEKSFNYLVTTTPALTFFREEG